ncbi:MAG: 2-oxoglutarate dehydrogenase E1 component [Buchnera aphidicola (Eriosoma harunire)]
MIDNKIIQLINFSCLNGINLTYLENLYLSFLKNKHSIHDSWHSIFLKYSMNKLHIENMLDKKASNYYPSRNVFQGSLNNFNICCKMLEIRKINSLITAFRMNGYQYANINPLLNVKKPLLNKLEISYYNFSKDMLHNIIHNTEYIKFNNINDLHHKLKKIYCNFIGYEFMHINNDNEKKWLQHNIETNNVKYYLTKIEKKNILKQLIKAELLEKFLSKKYPSTKRFSLEGAEVLIPMLNDIIHYGGQKKIEQVVLGMAHRGRLNVLTHVLGKKYEELFNEFKKDYHNRNNSGDVKYHAGYSSTILINSHKKIECLLTYNPSHLEIITPVVMGIARAKVENKKCNHYNHIIPITIHGDASITGQGVIQEVLNMSQTEAYTVGGTIRIIINNQIGFTTSEQTELRSTYYCTDIGKMIQVPIFHVNADDPESAIFAIRLAFDFRLKFKKDVFIDLVCYRRHGHNEIDDPLVTQPQMYKKIKLHTTIPELFFKKLLNEKCCNNYDKIELLNKYQSELQKEYDIASYKKCTVIDSNIMNKNIIKCSKQFQYKSITSSQLKKLAIKINQLPKNINLHARVKKLYQDRMDMALENKLFDWGASESLAYATILEQGISCRISGEDTCRGTFFHRHSVIFDQKNNSKYIPLEHISNLQGRFKIYNSVLSEEAVLAFEYGFSITIQDTITIWEAQFGDFANVAQVVIDQFISAGEQKWGVCSNLIILLSHGYEGQGPEHSSARIERFLQLCAENNMQICVPSTSAQFYHLLRRQTLKKIFKPLIIMTPKYLLRYTPSCSSFNDLLHGKFNKVIHISNMDFNNNDIKRIIFCTGKIYYDLLESVHVNKQCDISIIRIEQLYPFPTNNIKQSISSYLNVKDFVWCQEEPKNQGAWQFIKNYICNIIPINATLNYIGRPMSASTATGYSILHKEQQKKIINNALHINFILEE